MRPLLEDGFQIVGTGAGRCVLRFPAASSLHDHVVKLARFGDGLTNSGIVQNHREVMLSLRHGESDRWPLVPVVDYHRDDFRWLVMRYGESIDDHSEETRERMVRTVQNRLRMLPDVIREVREPNVVLVDGDPLLADYGRPEGI